MTADDANLSLVVTLRYWREDDCWVGRCDELGVSTFDPSLDTLVTELQEMAEDHIALLQETGSLDDFLSGLESVQSLGAWHRDPLKWRSTQPQILFRSTSSE